MLKGHRADRGNQIRSFLREKTYKESHCLQATLGCASNLLILSKT